MTPPTYADALAACREQWGEPSSSGNVGTVGPYAFWRPGATRLAKCVHLSGNRRRATVRMAAFDDGSYQPARMWTLAGTPTPDAPLAPLPDAIAAAGRWLAARGATTATTTTKGP